MRPAPAPAVMEELWPLLHSAGLIDDEQRQRLALMGGDTDAIGVRLAQLVQAGVLTAYQARQVLGGKIHTLRLGPYQILDRLGSGGTGSVYKASHILLKRLVALKVFRRRKRGWESAAEIEVVGRLAHPHIVTAYDAARFRGRLVLVLEYVDGIDLERLVTEAGPLPIPLACAVVRQAALALAYLHDRGLVHRDVKPANLLLLNGKLSNTAGPLPNRPPLVKLVDLGLACRAGQGGELSGTPDYLAPECGMAPDAIDIRGDLYSLGCTFYQLLTGRVPFPGGSWTGKLLRHRLEEPEPVRALRSGVPDDVAAVLARLMARDPDERYPDPAALLTALDGLQPASLEPVTLPPPPGSRRFALRPWVLVATILAGSAIGGAARLTLPSPTKAPSIPSAPVVARQEIIVSGIDRPFTDLAAAVAAAPDGATLTLRGAGPFRTGPLNCQGKALTLRAGPGSRPVIQRHELAANWDALLFGDRPLTLEGLDLDGGKSETPAPIVSVAQATLCLRDCGVRGRSSGPLLELRGGQFLELDGCRVIAASQALAVEVESPRLCHIHISQSHIEVRDPCGPALLLWSAEEGPATRVPVEILKSTLSAGRIIACRSLTGPTELTVANSRFGFQQALVSLDGYRDVNAWRHALRWSGRDNHYDKPGPWLRLEGKPAPTESESAWQLLALPSGARNQDWHR